MHEIIQPSGRHGPRIRSRFGRALSSGLIVAALLIIFALDRGTEASPVQHLYYVPIIFAGLVLGAWAGPAVALASVLLYHLANPFLFTTRYSESDLVQIALFLAVGIATARFTHDARRLGRLAITDDLTGLYNLRGFEAHLAAMIANSRRMRTPVALLVLDVDRLKSINDNHGHLAGADAVRFVGHVLAAHLEDDAVACRFGGDEFVVALPGCGETRAKETADHLRHAVHAAAPLLAGIGFPAGTLSISIGVACLSYDKDAASGAWPVDDAEAGEAVFRVADRALYVAKGAGRNRVGAA